MMHCFVFKKKSGMGNNFLDKLIISTKDYFTAKKYSGGHGLSQSYLSATTYPQYKSLYL